ncbi:FAD dependent oxidoreductase [Lutibacter oricola]|uniref:FAD dependent oxidoreductase n=1 Tax=Lutibacter oricola TaxID=762486 RepID=A0A1H2XX40_9FLAO|nr:FAD-dependent oxidoreductase [Lutibacter oricola]SDW97390.1 FAD dependent oxidoreductase [Lutibacter oricola]
MNRKQFIGTLGCASLAILAGGLTACVSNKKNNEFVFLEAEQFENLGGWDLDQQSMEQMGSPYLLAHGLGIPVEDATTEIEFPSKGTYRVWVRTRDWVAPWKVEGAPGKFQLLINSEPLNETFGTKGAEWHWHDGGLVTVDETAKVSLHDLTGFEGRCEAILFCKDIDFEPSNNIEALTKFRRNLLGLPEKPKDGGSFDLAIVGGGFAGTCAAISAARNGLNVVLIQDRTVLGGNGSSEVRVWPEGKIQQEPYPHIGDIVAEISPDLFTPKFKSKNAGGGIAYNDARKMAVVKAEPRITLMTEERVINVKQKNGKILSVVSQNTKTAEHTSIKANYFSDCTGDATVGFMAGADFEISSVGVMGMSNLWNVLDASNKKEVLECDCKDKAALTISCDIGKTEQPFPRCPWAIDLTDKPFPGRKNYKGQWGGEDPLGNLGGWFWESGFDKNPITDVEIIRDLNLRAMYGAWDALKNVDKLYPNHRLGWSAYIAGKRESRRLLGDVILSADNFRDHKTFPDPAFPCSWHIDIHTPHKDYDDDLKGNEFISQATTGKQNKYKYKGIYWAPYRTLYSRNINNLFMAGRDISVTREGIGPIRVMKTCGMMGEIVGKAASLCSKYNISPKEVYEHKLDELQELMRQPGNKSV